MSAQIQQLQDRISRLESDLKQLQQRMSALIAGLNAPIEPEAKRGPGRPKKAE